MHRFRRDAIGGGLRESRASGLVQGDWTKVSFLREMRCLLSRYCSSYRALRQEIGLLESALIIKDF